MASSRVCVITPEARAYYGTSDAVETEFLREKVTLTEWLAAHQVGRKATLRRLRKYYLAKPLVGVAEKTDGTV